MARDFDGSDDKIAFTHLADYDFGTADYSISAVVKSTGVARMTIIGKHTGGIGFGFDMLADGKLRLFQDVSSNYAYRTSVAAINNGAWRRVGASKAAGAAANINLYIDGTVSNGAAFDNGPAPNVNNTGELTVGTTQHYAQFFDGEMAEVALWNAALTAGEFASLGKGFSPLTIRPQLLVFYVPIIGRYSPEVNLIGPSGTLTGTTTTAHPPMIYPSKVRTHIAVAAATGTPRSFGYVF